MTPPFKLPMQRLGRATQRYEDVDHAALMKERMAIEGWTQQLLADRHADNAPYICISKVDR